MSVTFLSKKIEPILDPHISRVVATDSTRDVTQPDADTQSVFKVEVPPWAENYEMNAADADSKPLLTDKTL